MPYFAEVDLERFSFERDTGWGLAPFDKRSAEASTVSSAEPLTPKSQGEMPNPYGEAMFHAIENG